MSQTSRRSSLLPASPGPSFKIPSSMGSWKPAQGIRIPGVSTPSLDPVSAQTWPLSPDRFMLSIVCVILCEVATQTSTRSLPASKGCPWKLPCTGLSSKATWPSPHSRGLRQLWRDACHKPYQCGSSCKWAGGWGGHQHQTEPRDLARTSTRSGLFKAIAMLFSPKPSASLKNLTFSPIRVLDVLDSQDQGWKNSWREWRDSQEELSSGFSRRGRIIRAIKKHSYRVEKRMSFASGNPDKALVTRCIYNSGP